MWKIIGLGLLVATFWTATGFSFPHDRMGGDGPGLGGPRLWHLLRTLNLTDTQKTQVRDLFAAHRSTVQTLRGEIRATRQQLVDMLLSPNPIDPNALNATAQQLASQRDQLQQEHLILAQEIHNSLTPAQLTQATQLKDQLRALQATKHQLLSPQP
jgi:Spy/CpxP family protein refolding chaperone